MAETSKSSFFIDHLNITEISEIIHKARGTVSRYINNCEGYEEEINERKKWSIENRKDYQRQWDRDNRFKHNDVSGETLKREHEIAVMILSSERFYERE